MSAERIKEAVMNEMISVAVPVYNTARFLGRGMDTLLSQTHDSLQVAAADDGSWDDSGALLDEIALRDERVIVIHQKNAGVTQARLAAVKVACGQYVGFMDSDDEIDPGMYERLLQNMKQYGAQISHCGHQVHTLDGTTRYFYNTGRLTAQDRSEGLNALLSGTIEPGLCNKLYHNTLIHGLLHGKKMDTSVRINEDLLMNYYLFRSADKLVYEDVCPYHYRKREGSASTAKREKRVYTDPVEVKRIILEDSRNTEEEKTAVKAFLSICVHEYEAMQKDGVFPEEQRNIRQTIIQNKKRLGLLDTKQRLAAAMIIYTPRVNRWVNRIYH